MDSNKFSEEDNSNLGVETIESDVFTTDDFFSENVESEPDDVIIVHMDIREPLGLLKNHLEEKIGFKLTDYTICLQEAQTLEPHKNLVDQCVRGEGLVQINSQVQLINKRINIVDVLKPTEAILDALSGNNKILNDDDIIMEDLTLIEEDSNEIEPASTKKHFHNWGMDFKFKKEQSRLKIPKDPELWTASHVRHWLSYVVRQFNLTHIKLSQWNIDGAELCAMTNEEFNTKVPYDPGNIFWTHLELLKKFKIVTTVNINDQPKNGKQVFKTPSKMIQKHSSSGKAHNINSSNECTTSGPTNITFTGSNNGQIQLWQFLLDILTDKNCTNIIEWIGGDGEFKLIDPERVAQLWGEKKNKPTMNYEKLSRALRYYYDGNMISKVPGKRFVYKFDCDLKLLIGYDAFQLSSLVNEKNHSIQFTY